MAQSAGKSLSVYTRAGRKRAGLPPPTPLFHGVTKLAHLYADGGEDSRVGGAGRKKGGADSEESSSEDEEGGTLWVQCDSHHCRKWRRLPSGYSDDLSRKWHCCMHPDPALQSCDTPEEDWRARVSRKRGFKFSCLLVGQIVWAKLQGYSPWPAVISPDPWSESSEFVTKEKEGCIYHVEFLGKPRTHRWLPEGQLEPYYGPTTSSLGTIKMSKRLDFAIEEASSLLPLSETERLQHCEYTETRNTPQRQTPVAKCGPEKPTKKKKKKTVVIDQPSCQSIGSRSNKMETFPQQSGSTDGLPLTAQPTNTLHLFRTLGLDLGVGNLVNIVSLLTQENSSHDLQSETTCPSTLPVTSSVQACKAVVVPSVGTRTHHQVHPLFLTSEKARGSTSSTCRVPAGESGSKGLASMGGGQTPASKPQTSFPTPAKNSLQEHHMVAAKSHTASSTHLPLPNIAMTMPRSTPGAPSHPYLTKKTPGTATKRKSRHTPKASSSSGKPRASRHQCPGRKMSPPRAAASHTIPEYFQAAGPWGNGREEAETRCPLDQLVPDWTQSVSELESQAVQELSEMEEMLTWVGGRRGSQPYSQKENISPPDTDQIDVESVLGEMAKIEDLMNDLSRHQDLPH